MKLHLLDNNLQFVSCGTAKVHLRRTNNKYTLCFQHPTINLQISVIDSYFFCLLCRNYVNQQHIKYSDACYACGKTSPNSCVGCGEQVCDEHHTNIAHFFLCHQCRNEVLITHAHGYDKVPLTIKNALETWLQESEMLSQEMKIEDAFLYKPEVFEREHTPETLWLVQIRASLPQHNIHGIFYLSVNPFTDEKITVTRIRQEKYHHYKQTTQHSLE